MKEIGVELDFGRWVHLNAWRERISRKATYLSRTKKSVFFGRDPSACAKYQQTNILLDLKHWVRFQEGCRAMVFAHQKFDKSLQH